MTKKEVEQTDEEWLQQHLKEMPIDEHAVYEWELWTDEQQRQQVDPIKKAFIAGYLKGMEKKITGKLTHEE